MTAYSAEKTECSWLVGISTFRFSIMDQNVVLSQQMAQLTHQDTYRRGCTDNSAQASSQPFLMAYIPPLQSKSAILCWRSTPPHPLHRQLRCQADSTREWAPREVEWFVSTGSLFYTIWILNALGRCHLSCLSRRCVTPLPLAPHLAPCVDSCCVMASEGYLRSTWYTLFLQHLLREKAYAGPARDFSSTDIPTCSLSFKCSYGFKRLFTNVDQRQCQRFKSTQHQLIPRNKPATIAICIRKLADHIFLNYSDCPNTSRIVWIFDYTTLYVQHDRIHFCVSEALFSYNRTSMWYCNDVI